VSARAGSLQGLHLHFEPTSGIAGDMAVAALVDAGVPAAVVKTAVEAMGVRGLRVGFGQRKRGAYVGRSFEVGWPGKPNVGEGAHAHGHPHDQGHAHDHGQGHDHGPEHEHPHLAEARGAKKKRSPRPTHDHRDYAEVKRLLARARLDPDARALAGDIFARIAEVEAALHGTRIDRVAFHEVGAYDSIADIVGVAAAIAHLAPASIGSLPPVVGTGRVRTAHGPVPVPAPATAALLAEIPIFPEGEGELTTPTGAAILAAVVDRFGPLPPMRLRAVGYGAGTRELLDRANVLRVVLGEPLGSLDAPAAPDVVLIEANLDDLAPQLVGPLSDALFAAGAVDVWSAPILMKKGRPALQLSALAPPGALGAVERAFFAHSTTLGLRRRALERVVLARSFATVETPYGKVRVKLGALGGEILGAQPEFEDCRRLAARAKVPAREVVSAASAAARALLPVPAVARAPARRRQSGKPRR
jgi:pyridinium-3,5-bisthiocarboxylic acid mononucleotide nickel chelatase